MRKNLLRMVHCKEFSEAASFKEPCLSFVLRNVICSYCNDCCDLDICRNADIQVGRSPPFSVPLSCAPSTGTVLE